jgi:hypothetical protein
MAAMEAIHSAARRGDVDIVAGMLDEDPGLLSSMWIVETLLTAAAWHGHVECSSLFKVKAIPGLGEAAARPRGRHQHGK